MTRSSWKAPTTVAFLQHCRGAKAGRPPGYHKLELIGINLALGHPLTEEQRDWLIAAIYKAVRRQKPVDAARAFELKWPRRGRPTNASLHRDSIELEKAVFMVRHMEADPKPHGARARAINAAAKEYGCERDELAKILKSRREEAISELEYRREEDERMEREAAEEAAEAERRRVEEWAEWQEREWRARHSKSPGKN